jgi:hypothetical protein
LSERRVSVVRKTGLILLLPMNLRLSANQFFESKLRELSEHRTDPLYDKT